MNPSKSQQTFVINASRIGGAGGLRRFAEAVLNCLSAQYEGIQAVLPRGVTAPAGMAASILPAWLGSSSQVSRLRPLLWLLYSAIMFPVERSCRVLSTTHHALPFHKHQILTVHDLRPYFEPDTWMQHVYFHFLLPRALRRCDGILTVSLASKEELISVYGIRREKIHVVPNVVAARRFEPCDPAEDLEASPPYLLMVGASWKHKNAVELLDHHELWKPDYRVKIVAGAGQYSEFLQRHAERLGIDAYVDIIEAPTDGQLAGLYMRSAALVYPSRREGFGLPPLEAMAFGRPVIVSDIPVFRELYGDVPFYVELGNLESWRRAFSELAVMRSTGAEDRKRAGIKLAASFSTERMCTALAAALHHIWQLDPVAAESTR
jgi:glycosyltransferase involved in cell wall biosynthesis